MRLLFCVSLIVSASCISPIFGTAYAEKMTFTYGYNGGNCNECEFTIADGTIEDSTVEDFRKSGGGGLILINSSGGSVLGAVALGREFRRLGVKVVVSKAVERLEGGGYDELPGVCESACTYAFMGGDERSIPEGSKFGIHSFATQARHGDVDPLYSAADISNVQILSGILLGHTQAMGVDPIVVQMASEEPSESMRYLTAEEAQALRLSWNPVLADPAHLEPYKNGLVAVAQTADKSATLTFFCSKSDQIKMMLSKPLNGVENSNRDETGYTMYITSVDGDMNWVDSDIPFIDYSYRSTNGADYRTAELTKSVVDKILKLEFIVISFGQIRAEHEYNHIIVPTKNLTDLLRLVQRNCI